MREVGSGKAKSEKRKAKSESRVPSPESRIPNPESHSPVRQRPRQPHPPAGKINVTPLIDVVMVLIIFYLIVGKLASDRRTKVDLPPSSIGAADDGVAGLTITIQPRAGGGAVVLVDGAEVPLAGLEGVLRARGVKESGRLVQVRADRGLEYSAVSPIIAVCRAAGLASVKLVADRTEGGGP